MRVWQLPIIQTPTEDAGVSRTRLGSAQSRWVLSLTVDSKLDAVRHHVGPSNGDAGDKAGLLLGRLTVLPALVLLPFLLPSFPLLLIGFFKPIPVIVLWLAVTAPVGPRAS